MTQEKKQWGAIIIMIALFAMIAFVTNLCSPMAIIVKNDFGASNVLAQIGNYGNFIAYLVMGIPAGMLIAKYGYKKTALIGLAVGVIGILVQWLSGHVGKDSAFLVYLIGAFISGFTMCILNCVVNPMLNLLGGGGNKGNQLIQLGGVFNSTAAVACYIMFTKIEEPEQAPVDTSLIKGALSHRHFALGALAIFLYMSVEVGTPTYILQYLTAKGIPASTVGLIVAVYWLMMLIGRFVGASIGGKVSSRTMITIVSIATLLLVSFGMFSPETNTVEVPGVDWASLSVIWQEVPVGILAFLLVGLCTSVMWGGIFNMAVEGLGKYTAIASGIFMTMVFGCAVMVAIQGWVADMTDYMTSYWVVLFSAAYILFYAAIGSKPSKKSE